MNINGKIYALKYKLYKLLENSLNADKEAIKNGATITFKDYCKIKSVDCTKTTLDRNKVLEICNKYGIDISTLENTTQFQRITIGNVPNEVNEKITQVLSLLELANDTTIVKVASKVATIVK